MPKVLDMLALFVDQELTDDDSGINIRYLASLTSSDWGLWKTATMVAERVDHFGRELLDLRGRSTIHERIQRLLEALDSARRSPSSGRCDLWWGSAFAGTSFPKRLAE